MTNTRREIGRPEPGFYKRRLVSGGPWVSVRFRTEDGDVCVEVDGRTHRDDGKPFDPHEEWPLCWPSTKRNTRSSASCVNGPPGTHPIIRQPARVSDRPRLLATEDQTMKTYFAIVLRADRIMLGYILGRLPRGARALSRRDFETHEQVIGEYRALADAQAGWRSPWCRQRGTHD
jgi:hypothetical protein